MLIKLLLNPLMQIIDLNYVAREYIAMTILNILFQLVQRPASMLRGGSSGQLRLFRFCSQLLHQVLPASHQVRNRM